VFPCRNMTTKVVIECLTRLFCLFGLPGFVHGDRGVSFMSRELKEYLTSRGVATSRTTPHQPTGNAQCERWNQTIWRTIKLMLHQGFLRRFRDPIRVLRISENYHRVPKVRENRVPRIREIGSLQNHTGYLTFSLTKKLCYTVRNCPKKRGKKYYKTHCIACHKVTSMHFH